MQDRPPLVVGSYALNSYFPSRAPKDIDLIVHPSQIKSLIEKIPNKISYNPIADGKKYVVKTSSTIYEIDIAWEDSSSEDILNMEHLRTAEIPNVGVVTVPDLKTLLLLKLSHRYLKNSPHFLKTMRDIQTLRILIGDSILSPEVRKLLKKREKETYTYAHPKLNVAKDTFFSGDGVEYVYDHDTIHLAMATFDRPAYKFFQGENEVLTSKAAFFELKEIYQLCAVLEESYVLALERSVIPCATQPKAAFTMALEKVCTSITSGWFREFAWENYDKVMNLYDPRYVDRFWSGVETGIVRKN